MIAVALDALIGVSAMGITLMLWSQKGLPQIQNMLTEDPPAVEELAPALLAATVVGLALPFLFAAQVARRGTTPGKAVMSLSVRNVATGAFPNYPRALSREALRFIHVAPFILLSEFSVLAIVMTIIVVLDMSKNRLSQTWYDRATHTIIVAPVVEQE
jgi:hypothetical protein